MFTKLVNSYFTPGGALMPEQLMDSKLLGRRVVIGEGHALNSYPTVNPSEPLVQAGGGAGGARQGADGPRAAPRAGAPPGRGVAHSLVPVTPSPPVSIQMQKY